MPMKGDTIVLTHGETLDENGNFTQENFQTENVIKKGGTKRLCIHVQRRKSL